MPDTPPRGIEFTPLEKPPTSPEACYGIAQRLYAAHQQEIRRDTVATGGINRGIDDALDKFPGDVRRHYWGHGVTKDTDEDRIAAAISILENHAIVGGTGPLHGGLPSAYTHGDFFVISKRDDHMNIRPDRTKPPERITLGRNMRTGEEVIALKVRPGAFVVSESMYSLVPDLRKMYPNERILKADELSDYIREQEGSNP